MWSTSIFQKLQTQTLDPQRVGNKINRTFIFQYNDISILTLDQPVTFTKNIRPICLPGGGRAYSGVVGTVIGWGSLRESKLLLFVKNQALYEFLNALFRG